MIDCEGVLASNQSKPSNKMIQALKMLSKQTNVMVNCGKTKQVVSEWFENLN